MPFNSRLADSNTKWTTSGLDQASRCTREVPALLLTSSLAVGLSRKGMNYVYI